MQKDWKQKFQGIGSSSLNFDYKKESAQKKLGRQGNRICWSVNKLYKAE